MLICRGGATLALKLYGTDANSDFDVSAGGVVYCDGVAQEFAAGQVLQLAAVDQLVSDCKNWL